MLTYFLMGLGFYCGAFVTNFNSFKGVPVTSILMGLILGIALWPAVLFIFFFQWLKNKNTSL